MSEQPWHIAVLIPARNEEELLPRCLRSIQAARKRLHGNVTTDVIVVADSCEDRTLNIAESILKGSGAVIASGAGIVGASRALAVQTSLDRHRGPRSRVWFANTDADCEVPEHWLVDHLSIAKDGFIAVAGIVDVDFSNYADTQLEERFRSTYMLFEDGTHPHIHGANLGIRADAYLSAGGWRSLATAEDHDLWHRLQSLDHLCLRDIRLKVLTSGRRIGRAPSGFAEALSAHRTDAA